MDRTFYDAVTDIVYDSEFIFYTARQKSSTVLVKTHESVCLNQLSKKQIENLDRSASC